MGVIKKAVRGVGKLVGSLLGTGEFSDAVEAQVDAANKQAENTRKQTAAIQQQIAALAKQNQTIAAANLQARQDAQQQQAAIEQQRKIAEEAARVRQENLQALETTNAAGDQVADVTPGGTANTVNTDSEDAALLKKRRAKGTGLSSTLGL